MSDDMTDFDPFEDLSDEELDAMLESGELAGGMQPAELCADVPEGFRSGFVALVGRPNAGKSTLLNACYGEKVAITSPVAQTTRRRLRAVVNREDCQLVIVDTPGIHKPKDGLGSELNKSALGELSDVDVIAFVIDASAPIGRGDAWVAERVAAAKAPKVLVLTKADLAGPEQMLKQLEAARELVDFDDEVVVSSTEGFNVEAFVDVVANYLPEGPRWFPEGMGTDEADEVLVAEFVREKVLRHTREEIPQDKVDYFSAKAVWKDGIYVEPLCHAGSVYIFGGGHVGRALVPVLATVGFRVVMYDNREELAKKENYPMASEVIFGSFSDISGKVALTANDYAVVMTPGHQADYEILSKVLGSDATYIGCIGSRTKVAKTRERLKCDGYTEEDIARVHAPIGLPILAETPEEIAISIAAEMIEHRARLAGQRH